MNPFLLGGSSYSREFTIFQPQHNSNWALTVTRDHNDGWGTTYHFLAFNCDQFQSDPECYRLPLERYSEPGVSENTILDLVDTKKNHAKYSVEGQGCTFTIIANHQDGICSSDALLIILKRPNDRPLQFVVGKKWFE